MSGKGGGSKRSTFVWKIVWKQFWSGNRCLQIPLQKICLCKLKKNLWYSFLAEATKPAEYFLVESRSSSGKLEKKHGTKKELKLTFSEEKSIWWIFSWHALTLGSHPAEKVFETLLQSFCYISDYYSIWERKLKTNFVP